MSFFASTDGPTNLQVLSRDSFDTVFSRTELSETQAAHLFHRFEIGHTRTTLGQFDVQSFCLAFGTERQTHGHLSEGHPKTIAQINRCWCLSSNEVKACAAACGGKA